MAKFSTPVLELGNFDYMEYEKGIEPPRGRPWICPEVIGRCFAKKTERIQVEFSTVPSKEAVKVEFMKDDFGAYGRVVEWGTRCKWNHLFGELQELIKKHTEINTEKRVTLYMGLYEIS